MSDVSFKQKTKSNKIFSSLYLEVGNLSNEKKKIVVGIVVPRRSKTRMVLTSITIADKVRNRQENVLCAPNKMKENVQFLATIFVSTAQTGNAERHFCLKKIIE
jgi:hypothetical protein